MCVNYESVSRDVLQSHFRAPIQSDLVWKAEVWQDYLAPILVRREGKRVSELAAFSMVPKIHLPPGVKRFSTMNARAETIGQLRSYAKFWKASQLCIVPMLGFFEPCYETGKAERWKIGLKEWVPFGVAGIYRSWPETDGTLSFAFSQITINADTHPILNRMHKPGDEKRSLVILPEDSYDDWLQCTNPEVARAFLTEFSADRMTSQAWPQKAIQVQHSLL